MTAKVARRMLERDPALLSEAELSCLVVELARLGGWKRYHTFDSRRSNHGFPDWVLAKGPRLLFVELKSEPGRVSAQQQAWLDALQVVANVANFGAPVIEVHVWRPSDWDEIVETLTGRSPRKERTE